eukprot:CAMPEP_0171943552 /NCGR_PEP_ID=MMETSP0993-20121228/39584_1 /TAXON_ID=483369 /ORGANISM="non described non described, Strain CCMP2098" /LENGTH=40 /DNA_ID= /DNA_START= /DNA_END= /DNA_ORIENTATION=
MGRENVDLGTTWSKRGRVAGATTLKPATTTVASSTFSHSF